MGITTPKAKESISWGITNWLANKSKLRLPAGDKQKSAIEKVIEAYAQHVGLKGSTRQEVEAYISKNWPRFTYWARDTYKHP